MVRLADDEPGFRSLTKVLGQSPRQAVGQRQDPVRAETERPPFFPSSASSSSRSASSVIATAIFKLSYTMLIDRVGRPFFQKSTKED